MKQILIDMPPYAPALERLRTVREAAVATVAPAGATRELPADLLRNKHVLFCTYPPTNFREMDAIEFVQISSVGYSQLYGLGLPERGVRACNARGVFDVTIAEWNLAMMVNLARDLRGMIRNQEHGIWDRSARFQTEVRGRVVGIWGYGGIGRATARLVKPLGMTVHVLSRSGVGPRENTYCVPGAGDPEGSLPDRVFLVGQEPDFLAGLDFLILAMPLTPSTTGLIGERELRALPTTAFVLNPARGPLIQEAALLKALREGWIAGAALDTHYYYPMPADHPLWRFPNVIMTPHISGSDQSPRFLERVWDIFLQNVDRYLAGEPLLNELTPAELG
ncbi:MAG: D-2-hydroxyacid dehydrogenase [Pirellulales bacterium]|nr:D-2-hydroxyacid dehydrogenase [Pirellulales bacterium]